MARRKVERNRQPNNCPTCGGSGGEGPLGLDVCASCEGTGVPVRVGVWRGRWVQKQVVVNGEARPVRKPRELTVTIRGADGSEQELKK